ncbi:CRISPR-associated endonuclease Cas3'' [Noviherbaspirillum pedocola]|uniref:HD domain-containing protein n=1 Tax=Noviherbaspirillum pedocola TaxID=2801341 RepID=A0A934T477_9BURK|nr:CRISPR-associated endonuclease Cas3'' [Noviherbaspirillum pedocola]MBK4738923.1 hypothetical protein [Noviherbaspirillum pedocola]
MNHKNPIIKATFIVFAFWWTVCNAYTLFTDPVWFWESLPAMRYGLFITVVGLLCGLVISAALIVLERSLALDRLKGGSFLGITSTIGPVPILAPPAKRVKAKECLPIESERVKQWIAANKETNPAYVALFMAVWETLSAHKTHPASHRKGGHGGRTLAEHCMAVADTALELAPGWSYDGVYIKRAGKTPKLIIAKRNAEYRFDPADPLIPILGLAHDIGKIEAYKLQPDGTVLTSESSSEQDDAGVKHDALGARILARIAEFWEIPPEDNRILSRVVAHYHHPSDFPVDKDGLALDDRMMALLEFLILADQTTGQRESGISAASANADAITETEGEEIYAAFVACVTEQGRINGTGNIEADKTFKIGQKHGNVVYLRDEALLRAMCKQLGVSIEVGRGRYILLNRILTVLEEKGILVTSHNSVDFKGYQPLYLVRFYHSETATALADWHQTIVIRPTSQHGDLHALLNLSPLATTAKIEGIYFAHLNKIADPAKLFDLVGKAFDDDVLQSVRKGIMAAGMPVEAVRTTTPAVEPRPAPEKPETAPIKVSPPNAGVLKIHATVTNTTPESVSPTPDLTSDETPFDWDNLDAQVKINGFDAGDIDGMPSNSPDAEITHEQPIISDVTPAGAESDDMDLLAPHVMVGSDATDFDAAMESDVLATSHIEPSAPTDEVGVIEPPAAADANGLDKSVDEPGHHTLGIPMDHDRGTAVQDVPRDPVSKYKKQKQAERNDANLEQLRQASNPSDFLQGLSASQTKKRAENGLVAYLGSGNNRKAPGRIKAAETGASSSDGLSEFKLEHSYEVFQKLVQRAVESGELHCLATLDGKHFVLQSMIEKAFPGQNIDERLPPALVERRSTSAGDVLLIPVAPLANG